VTTNRPTIIAHRGASKAHRENTVEAFAAAGPLGAEAVELDVRRTADGTLVIHHDPALDDGRTILDLALADLPGHVPTLAQALDACGGLVVNVEIKNDPSEPDFDADESVAAGVVDEIERRGTAARILVSSFHRPTIDRVRVLMPELATALLHADPDRAARLAEAVEHGHGALHPWFGFVDEALVDEAHAAGVAVNVWTVDDPETMVRLAAAGVDGIVTNVPDVALATLGPRPA